MRIFLVVVAMLAGCSSQLLPPRTAGGGLAGWQAIGAADWRRTPTGVAAGPAETSGFLASRRSYSDFTLTLEFRIDDATNSGVFIRCRDRGEITPVDCYEINIWDNHPNQDFRTGSIVTRQAPLAHVDTLERWNRMRIDARAGTITVTVNGVVTARLVDDSLAAGFVALQYAGTGVVEFRHVEFLTD